jgi:polar amino acid transport system substrate-binding protein
MKKIMITLILFIVLTITGCEEQTEKVTVLTSSGYAPYEIIDTDGSLTGFDIELMEALAAEIGIEIEWKDVSFDGIIASLQSGQAEIAIAGISPTDDRKENVDFSNVYYDTNSGLSNHLVYLTEDNIQSLDDLEGLVVGAQMGTVQATLLEDFSEIYNFTYDLRNTNTQIVEEIKAGRIDVLVVEEAIALEILELNSELSSIGFSSSLDSVSGNAIAFSKGSEYVDLFNEALVTLEENGTLQALIDKWFN